MKEKIQEYFNSLNVGKDLRIYIDSCISDGIYAVRFVATYGSLDGVTLADILLSEYDKEEDWKFEIRDMVMKSLAHIYNDSQILVDRYKSIDEMDKDDI